MQGTAALARTGRKRKSGRRHPNGELVSIYVDPRKLAAQQPHRRWLPVDKRLDQKADTLLGSLELIGAISADQGLAGEEYAKAVGRYRVVLKPPAGMVGSGRGHDCNPEGCMEYPQDCDCLKRKTRYEQLYEVLGRCGRKSLMAVNRVVIHGQRIQRSEMELLRFGLSALARYLGLTGYRKSDTSRNAH